MKLIDLSSEDERSRSVLRVIAAASTVVLVAILAYAIIASLVQPVSVIGANLVNIEFPSPSISPIYFKPITILYIAAALLLYSGLELQKDRVRSLSEAKKSLVKAFAFIVAVVFLFELGYNFVYWSGQIAADSIRGTLNPDLIVNTFPNPANPVNVVFASRLFALFSICGVYVFYYMTKLEREDQARTLTRIATAQ